jgi:hypothetical protein
MVTRIINAKYIDKYIIWIQFNDGIEGKVNLEDELWGPVFEPLKDINQFRKFSVNPELHTIAWENGADLSPEFLRTAIQATA